MYVIGKTGTGKSTLLETMIRQDIKQGNGLALLDPHGDLVIKAREYAEGKRQDELIYFDVTDPKQTMGFNPLEAVSPAKKRLAASGMVDAFKKLWSDSWGPRLEHILRNSVLVLLDQPEATLADILRLLDDPVYRKSAAAKSPNAQVRRFWLKEYEGYPVKFRAEAIAPLQNKVGAFLSDPLLTKILNQPKSSFDLRQVMDDGQILLVNLGKGKIGEDAASLLGSLLISQINLSAMSRADVSEEERRDFFVYLDEFQSYTTKSLAVMLSELRKYHVGMVLAHQHLSQIDPLVRDAIFGNVGSMITFRVGLPDAEILAKEFFPQFSVHDLLGLPNHEIYLRLMINGQVSQPFSAETILPSELD